MKDCQEVVVCWRFLGRRLECALFVNEFLPFCKRILDRQEAKGTGRQKVLDSCLKVPIGVSGPKMSIFFRSSASLLCLGAKMLWVLCGEVDEVLRFGALGPKMW